MFLATKRNKERRNDSAFAELIANPIAATSTAPGADRVDVFTMPANGRLAVSFNAILTVSQLRLLVGSRIIFAPALAANKIHEIGFFEKDQSIGFRCAIAGAVTVYHLDSFSRPNEIASGVIA
jgi:hypothetical protein